MAKKQGILFLQILHDEQFPVYLFVFFRIIGVAQNWLENGMDHDIIFGASQKL